MTQQTQRTFARANLLRTCYGLVTGKLVKWILAYKQHVNLKRQKTNLRYITIGLRKDHFNVDSKTDVLCTEHSSAITRRREEARPHQARAAGSPSLAWLRVPQRVQFELCLLTFKALHGLASPYIADLCRPVTSVGSRQRLRSATRAASG